VEWASLESSPKSLIDTAHILDAAKAITEPQSFDAFTYDFFGNMGGGGGGDVGGIGGGGGLDASPELLESLEPHQGLGLSLGGGGGARLALEMGLSSGWDVPSSPLKDAGVKTGISSAWDVIPSSSPLEHAGVDMGVNMMGLGLGLSMTSAGAGGQVGGGEMDAIHHPLGVSPVGSAKELRELMTAAAATVNFNTIIPAVEIKGTQFSFNIGGGCPCQ
jgi:hypothetical protein